MFFTATFPYLLLMAFLIRGLTLPGAMEGNIIFKFMALPIMKFQAQGYMIRKIFA